MVRYFVHETSSFKIQIISDQKNGIIYFRRKENWQFLPVALAVSIVTYNIVKRQSEMTSVLEQAGKMCVLI